MFFTKTSPTARNTFHSERNTDDSRGRSLQGKKGSVKNNRKGGNEMYVDISELTDKRDAVYDSTVSEHANLFYFLTFIRIYKAIFTCN